METWINATLGIITLGSLLVLSRGESVLAQSVIVPDNTLGSEKSLVTPNYQNLPVEAISGGAQRGQNLFHSFLEFNVSSGRGAYFNVLDAATRNVLVRVTGVNASQIFGTLGTFGNANPNLFLMNPNGIIFGPHATLDIGGAFIATTANAIALGNQGLFSATAPETSNLLSVQPSALFFNKLNPLANIVNQSTATSLDFVLGGAVNSNSSGLINGLQVLDGNSLLLVGGDITIEGGQLVALGGSIELGGLTGSGTVGINSHGSLNYPQGVTRGNVTLSQGAQVSVTSGGGGNITINANNLLLSGTSGLNAGIASGQGNANAQAGDIVINALGNIQLTDGSFIANTVIDNTSTGNAGNIQLKANSLSLEPGSLLTTISFGTGNAGNITINVQDALKLDNSVIEDGVETSGVGQGGDISLTAHSIELKNGAKISSSIFGIGKAGNITINSTGDITLSGADQSGNRTAILSDSKNSSQGSAGEITLNANNLFLSDGGGISSSTYGTGNAGNITINVQDVLKLDNGFIENGVAPSGIGQAGNISLTAGSIELQNGGIINSSIFGTGNAGNIIINVQDVLKLDNGFIENGVAPSGIGQAGNISLTAGSIELQNGGINTSTYGTGNAGNITINVQDVLKLDNSVIQDGVAPFGVGQGGDIFVTAKSIELQNISVINSSAYGTGNAGNITINAQDALKLDNSVIGALIYIGAVGNGGNISLTANSIELKNVAAIGSNTSSTGKAGNITINVQDVLKLDNGYILDGVAPSGVGQGGDIFVTAKSIELKNGSNIDSSTFGTGNAGNIFIQASDSLSLVGFSQSTGISSGIFVINQLGATGATGSIKVNTNDVEIANGAVISAITNNNNPAGKITINANSLELIGGGQIISSTRSGGDAGEIFLNISNSLTVDGQDPTYSARLASFGRDNVDPQSAASAILASTTSDSTGKGGSISIDPQTTVIKNGAGIGVNSLGSGEGGNINLTSGNLTLENQGFISAETASNTGGNINLNVENTLLLRNNSNISTTAGTALTGGNGGNIDINAQFIVAFPRENSNITANAYEGNGGNIQITTQGLFGLDYRNELTPFSELTASSQFGVNGLVNINLLKNEPLQRLATLPNNIIDVLGLLTQPCLGSTLASNTKESQFIKTGRGGLPSNPNEPLAAEAILSPPWVTVDSSSTSAMQTLSPTSSSPESIVEAKGWTMTPDGEIQLIAVSNTVTPDNSRPVSNSCSGVR